MFDEVLPQSAFAPARRMAFGVPESQTIAAVRRAFRRGDRQDRYPATSPSGERWKMKIGVILGGTRGIGRALVERVAEHWGKDGLVYLTARDDAAGAAVAGELRCKGLPVDHLLFDLADKASAARLATLLLKRHGGIDCLVQNGAYMPRAGVPASLDARPMIEANNHGTLRVLRAFLPILRPNGRIVVVASSFGTLSNLPQALRSSFDTRKGDPGAIDRLMEHYVEAAEAGTAQSEGWPEWVNIPSKVGQVAVTRAFAFEARQSGSLPEGALINCANPGLTLTDATRPFMDSIFKGQVAQSPEQAAEPIAWLATRPAGVTEPYGELVDHQNVIPFGDASASDES